MSGLDLQTREILDRFVPVPTAAAGDWDAVVAEATAVRRRTGWTGWRAAALVAAASAAVLAAVLAWPFGGSSGGILERASAALGSGPVLHVVTREAAPKWLTVDLATGERRVSYQEVETWSDPERGSHWIARVDGRVVDDSLWQHPMSDPALTTFVTGYREALAAGSARVVSDGELDGVKVHWLEFRPSNAATADDAAEQVAVDAQTFEPLALRWEQHGAPLPAPLTKVLSIETQPAGAGDFTAPEPRTYPSRGDVVDSNLLERAQAQGSLPTPVLWPGPRVAGLDFALVRADDWKIVYTDPEPQALTGKGVRLVYGDSVNGHPDFRGESLYLAEASYPTFAYGWQPFEPAPDHATVRIKVFAPVAGSLGGADYQGELVRDGTYVVIHATSEDAVIAAAKALEPMPAG